MRYHGDPTADWLLGKNKQVTISLNDSRSIADAISKFVNAKANVVDAAYEAIERLCSVGEDIAKSECPKDTWELCESITHETKKTSTGAEGTITAGTDHAMFVEFGTGVRGRGSYPEPIPGWEYDVNRRDWQGHEANPFMYRTVRILEERAEDIINGNNN